MYVHQFYYGTWCILLFTLMTWFTTNVIVTSGAFYYKPSHVTLLLLLSHSVSKAMALLFGGVALVSHYLHCMVLLQGVSM